MKRLTLLLILMAAVATANAQDQRYFLYGGGFHPADEPVVLSTWLSGRPATDLVLYRVENPGDIMQLGGPGEFDLAADLELTEFLTREVTEAEPNRNTNIDLGVLPIGVYLAQLGPTETGSAVIVLVTDLALVTKRDDSTMLIYTSDLSSGEPVDAELYLLEEGTVTELEARPGGVTVYPTGLQDTSGSIMVSANRGDSWAFSDAWWSQWTADTPTAYIATDRPVYRPGDEVGIAGTIRLGRSVRPVADEQVTITVQDADYEQILERTATTNEYGSFATDFELPASAPLGYYQISVQVGEDRSWASFHVEEYRVPEYEITVSADEPWAIHGESASFTVSAEYLSGGPVGGATVEYAVMSEPYSRYAWRSEYGFYSSFSFTHGGSVIARGETTLGPDGQAVIPVDLQRQDQDYRLTLQAQVSDESDEQISDSDSLIAYRADLVLGVTTERYAVPDSETAAVTVTAQDLEGNPVSTDFTIETEHRRWVEGTGVVREAGPVFSGTTDSTGTATLNIEPGRIGSWTITAGATDEAGRFTDSSSSLWIYGGEAWYWDYEYLEITVDQDEYHAGDTARFVIQSPVAGGWALITHEGDRIGEWHLVPFEGNSLTYEFTVPGTEVPNSWLSVIVVGDGDIYQAATDYHVHPGDRFLDVDISTPADTFEPGESTEIELLVSDSDGRPVQAQLTVGVVDEGVYLIRPEGVPDIRGFFYSQRPNNINTELSTWTYFSQIAPAGAAREAMDEAVFAQAKSDAQAADGLDAEEARLREDFEDTIMWLPDIETDDSGRATVSLDFADNLTRWRITVRAVTRDGLVGQNTASVTTTLPVIARLAMPSYLVRGDEARVRVIGQSNLDETVAAHWSLHAEGLELQDPDARNSELPAGARATQDWWVTAEQTGTAQVEAQVLSDQASDALRMPLTVVPHGMRTGMVWADQGTAEWQFELPDNARISSVLGSATLTPHFTAAVTPAVDWLWSLDYGYTELTMSSLIAISQAAASDMSLPEELADPADLDEYLSGGLQHLYRLQHPDGGFGFWRYDTSSPLITAYVVDGLLTLREHGVQVRDRELNRAFEYLQAASQKDVYEVYAYLDEAEQRTASADARAFAWLALARGGYEVHHLHGLPGDSALSNHGLALAILALSETGDRVEADLYLDELLSRLTEREAVAYLESGAPRYVWSDDRVHTTALALRALAELRSDAEVIPRLVNWLLLERSGRHWYSSKATAAVVRAALALDTQPADPGEDDDEEPVIVTVLLNNIIIEEVELGEDQLEVDLSRLAAPGRNVLRIEAPDYMYVSAGIDFMVEDGFAEAAGNGISVTRTFAVLTPEWQEEEQQFLYSQTETTDFAVGDFVVGTITIEPEGHARYVTVFEPLPAGFSVVEEDRQFRLAGVPRRYGDDYWGWNYWYDGREIREQGIDYHFARLSEPVSFTYIMRADHAGSFAALPTRVHLAYEQDVQANSAAQRLSVESE